MLRSTLFTGIALLGLAGCCRCPEPQTAQLPITEEEVVSGKYAGIPLVGLYWGQSVSFVLVGPAAKDFKFKQASEALTLFAAESSDTREKRAEGTDNVTGTGLIPTDRSVLEDVEVKTTDSTLTLTIKRDTKPWLAKGTLFFDSRGDKKPGPKGVDPGVQNWGPPH